MKRQKFSLFPALLLLASCIPGRAEIGHSPFLIAPILRLATTDTLTITSRDISLKLKSKGTATALSGLCAGIPVALGLVMALQSDGTLFEDPTLTTGVGLISGGMIFGPAAGYFYAEDYGRAIEGIGIRTVTSGFFICIAVLTYNPWEDREGGGGLESLGKADAEIRSGVMAVVFMAIGTGIVLISDVIDIVKVHKSVEKYNARALANKEIGLSLSPTLLGPFHSAGLSLRINL